MSHPMTTAILQLAATSSIRVYEIRHTARRTQYRHTRHTSQRQTGIDRPIRQEPRGRPPRRHLRRLPDGQLWQ